MIKTRKRTLLILFIVLILIFTNMFLQMKKKNYLGQIEQIVSDCIYDYGKKHNKYISDADDKKISDAIRKKGSTNDFEIKKLDVSSEEENWQEQYVWVQVVYYAASGIYKEGEAERFKCYFETKEGHVYVTKVEKSIN